MVGEPTGKCLGHDMTSRAPQVDSTCDFLSDLEHAGWILVAKLSWHCFETKAPPRSLGFTAKAPIECAEIVSSSFPGCTARSCLGSYVSDYLVSGFIPFEKYWSITQPSLNISRKTTNQLNFPVECQPSAWPPGQISTLRLP